MPLSFLKKLIGGPGSTAIVGLGNPGKKHEDTRHNVGFLVVGELAKRLGTSFAPKQALKAEVAEAPGRLILAKPQTFMNKSGSAVGAIRRKNGIPAERVLIIYDDADLPLGEVRLREGGSSGGQRGMQSVIEEAGGKEMPRIRVGIGRPENDRIPLDRWVLGKWTPGEREKIEAAIEKAADMAMAWLEDQG